MHKYDGFLFGNGLSLNLLNQLKSYIPTNKHYLLCSTDFINAFVNNKISTKEDNKIFDLFYSSKNVSNYKNYKELKEKITEFCKTHNSDIEYHLGVDLFRKNECDYDYAFIETTYPFLYNIWHEILLEYINHLSLDYEINIFMQSVKQYLDQNSIIFTTNFDKFADDLEPKHLHGTFEHPFKKYKNLILYTVDENEFYYKCIWGWNGIGKLNFINTFRNLPMYKEFFNFDFFFENSFHINHLLLYGIGFRTSGYIGELAEDNEVYKKPAPGGIIDEHILIRLKGLQNRKQLDHITITYYSDSELFHFKKLIEHYKIENVRYSSAADFTFTTSI